MHNNNTGPFALLLLLCDESMSNYQKDFWRTLNNSALIRFLLLFACGWVVVQIIAYFYGVIAMFVTAAILAVLMDYPVRKLTRFVPREIAITLVVLGTVAIALLFVTVLGFQILTQGRSLLDNITTTLQSSNLPFREYLQQINLGQIADVLRKSLSTGLGVLGGVFSNMFTAIFLLVIAIYMLVDGKKIWSACLKLVPADVRDRFDANVQRNFLGFLRAQITLVIFLSTTSFIVFSLLGVQFSLVLAIVIGVLDAIPGIGATLGVLVVTALVFLTQGQWVALRVVIASVILQQIQDNYVHPKVMGKALEINPVLLFFALFVGERIAGLLGIFLAIPITGMMMSWLKSEEEVELADDAPVIELESE
ncbi:putative permease [Leptolyngbyaceae cyanobacterium JSC-12]|nr:putative permease [Leptolyngbyaceae cyanobacterium JSC-12]